MNLINFIIFSTIFVTLILAKPYNKICGLPKNINTYPNYVIEQLQIIWKYYVPSSNCDAKYLLTQNVLRLHSDIVDHLSEVQESTYNDIKHDNEDYHSFEPIKPAQALGSKSMPVIEKPDYQTQPEQSYFFSNSGNYESRGPTVPVTTTGEDAPGPYLNTEQATFLKHVTPQVRDMFLRLFYDTDIPSESLRDHKLHMLAISMLDSETLKLFDTWAVARRKALKDISSSSPKKNSHNLIQINN
uniref:SXP/RAL-2 family protein Ani s 5-like cation-binding domain-containing protein n=1 Tax=Strongyloides stercoralis TaxID=6248 RepID=A0A0K0E9Y3_STRER